MVKHVVSFKLKGSDEERRLVATRFRDALLELPSKIDVLESIEVGLNENPAEVWDVVLIAVLPNIEAVETYAKHPAHVAAASILGEYKETRSCVDFSF